MLRAEKGIDSIEEIVKVRKETSLKDDTVERPDRVKAMVYKMQSNFVRHNVYITLGYVVENEKPRPIEIFINSKDLSKSPEYTVLTRLLSAIFRKTPNPAFILEELGSINDPNGGYHKNGKYIHSFYSEVALVIEKFFNEIGILSKKDKEAVSMSITEIPKEKDKEDSNEQFSICPDCGERALKTENGCSSCTSCGASKCGG